MSSFSLNVLFFKWSATTSGILQNTALEEGIQGKPFVLYVVSV